MAHPWQRERRSLGWIRSLASSTLLTGGEDHPQARFTAHHAGVRFCGTFQGNRFDYRTNVLEHAERQGILDIDGGADQGSLE